MPRRSPNATTATERSRAALVVRLQILAAVFLPMLLIGIWLNSKGFFQSS
ncbi:hypothetical protein NZK33_07525 [Cyanobium sp. FGCU-6]|nr:hypothetical protein [Cyanobium sp. FGCU6]